MYYTLYCIDLLCRSSNTIAGPSIDCIKIRKRYGDDDDKFDVDQRRDANDKFFRGFMGVLL